MNPNYKQLTVRDIIDAVLDDKFHFPKGIDTPILSGDFEGNYTHRMHEMEYDEGSLFLGYEMHEGG